MVPRFHYSDMNFFIIVPHANEYLILLSYYQLTIFSFLTVCSSLFLSSATHLIFLVLDSMSFAMNHKISVYHLVGGREWP
jgi:hypothetical protein